jgi:hypothetical protein
MARFHSAVLRRAALGGTGVAVLVAAGWLAFGEHGSPSTRSLARATVPSPRATHTNALLTKAGGAAPTKQSATTFRTATSVVVSQPDVELPCTIRPADEMKALAYLSKSSNTKADIAAVCRIYGES